MYVYEAAPASLLFQRGNLSPDPTQQLRCRRDSNSIQGVQRVSSKIKLSFTKYGGSKNLKDYQFQHLIDDQHLSSQPSTKIELATKFKHCILGDQVPKC